MFQREAALLVDDVDMANLKVTPESTFIVLDWDDTLLPTSWLAKRKLSLDSAFIPSKDSAELEAMDAAASGLLRKAAFLYGHVLIITNAQQGWVELSSKKFLPETHSLLFSMADDASDSSGCSFSSSSSDFRNNSASVGEKRMLDGCSKEKTMSIEEYDSQVWEKVDSQPAPRKISVFSARHLFEKDFPCNPSAWKKKAFQKLLEARISPRFFVNDKSSGFGIKKSKSLSDTETQFNDPESKHSPPENNAKRQNTEHKANSENVEESWRLQRSLSDINSLDLSGLVEIEGESFEIETDFDENDSFFSIDFRAPVETKEKVDEEFQLFNDQEISQQFLGSYEQQRMRPCCNLISIGDCFHDCLSLREIDLPLKDVIKKTVKLREFPTASQLTAELDALQMYIDRIVKLRKESDLEVDKACFR